MKTVSGRVCAGAQALCAVIFFALCAFHHPMMAHPDENTFTEEELKRIEGDYRVEVYPQPLGIFVEGGTLHLKVGGLASLGQAVPLIQQPDGKFVISEGHPNAFEFQLEGDQVKFTFYSAGTAFPGMRSEKGAAEPPSANAGRGGARREEKLRSQLLEEMRQFEAEHGTDPQDTEKRLQYATLIYQSGEFWRAREIVSRLAEDAEASADALSLAATLEYLTGRYDHAEELYKRLIKAKEGDVSPQTMAKVNLAFTYYQTNRFDKAKEIELPAGAQLPFLDQMKAFAGNPYRLEWHNEERVSIVPFVMTDPLPVLTIEVNKVPLLVFFDTGGDTIIIDNDIAEALGIELVAKVMGTFGGGKKHEIGFGKVESVKVGDVTMKQVPVTILPSKRFSGAFGDGKFILGGVIGTAAMRQFLGTIDYANERMILRERTEESARRLRKELAGKLAAEVPFVLRATHLMTARGSLNEKSGLTFFVDSGLAGEAAFTAPKQTLEYAGIPIPERKLQEGVGGGGGRWETGEFEIERLVLGPLEAKNLKGEYGALTPESYWAGGYIQDGLISHRFLRRYSSWTLDFDSMTYLFEK